jgi:hypothetical protein
MDKFMSNPLNASLFAAAVTAAAVYFTTEKKETAKKSTYTKPALFVGLLVYFIIYAGSARYETISKEPF